MKRFAVVGIAVAALMTAASSYGQTNVYSRNAVGAIRLDMERGRFYLASHVLNPLGTNASTPELVLGTTNSLPVSTLLLLWDPTGGPTAAGAYKTEILRSNGKWNPGTNSLLGKGFWVSIPAGAPSNSYTVYLMGEVPDATTLPTSAVAYVTGSGAKVYNMLTYTYPSAVPWTNTTLAAAAAVSDLMSVWDPKGGAASNGAYMTATKRSNGTWGGAGAGAVFQPGQGFWFATSSVSNLWIEVKPYNWP